MLIDGKNNLRTIASPRALSPNGAKVVMVRKMDARLGEAMEAELHVGSAKHKELARRLLRESPDKSAEHVRTMLDHAFATVPLSDELKESARRDVMTFCFGSMVWAESNYPTFNLTLDFFRALLVTDFGDVGEEVMHLPFSAFVVHCPEPLIEETHNLFIYPMPDPVERDRVHWHFTRMTLEASNKSAHRQAFTQWSNGQTFDAFLHGAVAHIDSIDPVEAAATRELGTTMDPDATALARRVLGNLLLYVNANGGLPTVKRLGSDVPVEREHAVEPRFRVGRPVKLGPVIRAALAPGQRGDAPAWKLAQRFMVRGFWRMQPYGARAERLRRRQWIQPYWKGPATMTAALERTFEVT